MQRIISMVIIFAVVASFYYFDTFYMVSRDLSDRFVQEVRQTDFRINILAIDDESLGEIGRWPWPRTVIADVAAKLAEEGALAVFVDVLYTEESQVAEEDQHWQAILDEYEQIYLPTFFQLQSRTNDRQLAFEQIIRPIYDLDAEHAGHINGWEDKDRVIRKVALGIRDDAGQIIPAMSVRLANRLLPEEEQISWNQQNEWFMGGEQMKTGPFSEIYFSYASNHLHSNFETYSLHRVINGEIDPAYFADSVVLIGPYAEGLQDLFYVPNSSTRMFGVEIHANITQSLLDKYLYREANKPLGMFIIVMVTLTAYLILERFSAKWSIPIYVLFMVVYFLLFYTVLQGTQLILPLFYVLLALSIVFIVSLVSQYIKERLERNRVTGIFGRYVAKSVVQEILSSTEELKLGGVKKDVSLIFVDIRGFTPLSEKLEPEEVIEILNEYLDLCTRAIFAYDGTLDKFMGDGVMAIFGAPIEQVDHAQRAVRAALQMKAQSDELARILQEKYGRSVSFGIGINSGPAVIGNIGSKERLDYTAIGDTVNLAARLEANAKPQQILISEETYNRVKDLFQITYIEAIKVKGKENLVPIYEVEGEDNERTQITGS